MAHSAEGRLRASGRMVGTNVGVAPWSSRSPWRWAYATHHDASAGRYVYGDYVGDVVGELEQTLGDPA
jgi:hypothetical protein